MFLMGTKNLSLIKYAPFVLDFSINMYMYDHLHLKTEINSDDIFSCLFHLVFIPLN